jgi:hypothetical protein
MATLNIPTALVLRVSSMRKRSALSTWSCGAQPTLPLSFATLLASLVKEASGIGKHCCFDAHTHSTKYTILLICTDGIISDLPETKKAIIEACSFEFAVLCWCYRAPIFPSPSSSSSSSSVLAMPTSQVGRSLRCGLTPAAMVELDSDHEPLRVEDRVAKRDIVPVG